MNLDKFKTVEQLAAAIKSMDVVTSVPWTDYSGTSTIVGWTSYTTKQIFYKKIGKLVFVWYWIAGESDSTDTTFTVPFSAQSGHRTHFKCTRSRDNGTWGQGKAYGRIAASGNTVIFHVDESTSGAGSWTNSGNKVISGEFFYEAA